MPDLNGFPAVENVLSSTLGQGNPLSHSSMGYQNSGGPITDPLASRGDLAYLDEVSQIDKQQLPPITFTKEDVYPNADQPLQIGQFSGPSIGNLPIFRTGGEALFPWGMYSKRRAALQQLAFMKYKEASKPLDLKFPEVNENAAGWEGKLREGFTNSMSQIIDESYGLYGANAKKMLMDPSTSVGMRFLSTKEAYNTMSKEINNIANAAAALSQAQDEGWILPSDAASTMEQIKNADGQLLQGYFDGSVNISNLSANLYKSQNLVNLTKSAFTTLQQEITTEFMNDPTIVDKSKGALAAFIVTETQKRLADGQSTLIAEGLAQAYPAWIYDPNSGNPRTKTQTHTVEDVAKYFDANIAKQVNKSGQGIGKPTPAAGSTKKPDVDSNLNYVLRNANTLRNSNNHTVEAGTGNFVRTGYGIINEGGNVYAIAGDGVMATYKDGKVSYSNTNDDMTFVDGILSIAAEDPAISGIGNAVSKEDIILAAQGNTGFRQQLNVNNSNAQQNLKKDYDTAKGAGGGVASRINFVSKYSGGLIAGKNIIVTSASDIKGKGLQLTADAGQAKGTKGVMLYASMLPSDVVASSNGSLGNNITKGGVLGVITDDTSGNSVFMPGYYYADNGKGEYNLVDDKGVKLKLSAVGGNSSTRDLTIPKQSVDGFFDGHFEAVNSAVTGGKVSNAPVAPNVVLNAVSGKTDYLVSGDFYPKYDRFKEGYNSTTSAFTPENEPIAKAAYYFKQMNYTSGMTGKQAYDFVTGNYKSPASILFGDDELSSLSDADKKILEKTTVGSYLNAAFSTTSQKFTGGISGKKVYEALYGQ